MVAGQPAIENLTELLCLNAGIPAINRTDNLDWRTITRVAQPRVCEIEPQHGEEHVEQSPENMGRFAARPNRGKRQNADQVIDAALKAFDLGCTFHFSISAQAADGGAALCTVCRSRSSRKNSSGGTKKGFSWRIPPIIIIGWV